LSNSAQLTSAGGYCWRGEFTSGTSGVPNATDATLGECFTVNPVIPFVPTQASADVQLGNPVSDLVNLNGTANQPGSPVINGPLGAPAGGTITFRLFGPNDTSCANPPVFTSAAIPVSGDALYFSGNFTPTQVGTYRWIASYSGNSPNTLATTGVCNAANESVVVNATPAISTAQTFTVKDSATITVAAGAGNLQGSLDFQLYSTSNCSGGLLFDSGPISVSGPSPQTRETITTTITAPGQPRREVGTCPGDHGLTDGAALIGPSHWRLRTSGKAHRRENGHSPAAEVVEFCGALGRASLPCRRRQGHELRPRPQVALEIARCGPIHNDTVLGAREVDVRLGGHRLRRV